MQFVSHLSYTPGLTDVTCNVLISNTVQAARTLMDGLNTVHVDIVCSVVRNGNIFCYDSCALPLAYNFVFIAGYLHIIHFEYAD
jgi:hypothetical protein